ncbi:MAG: neutral/alkaline non-lysosomal ceramidase N-terminal domain-containing protein [Deltaproteobacteria bacterium]|nr:MAG: neutral/alkaline non-lysosomal ceramidase N-terminal domain-containing protein [Deltaproteobacteria bacterium]
MRDKNSRVFIPLVFFLLLFPAFFFLPGGTRPCLSDTLETGGEAPLLVGVARADITPPVDQRGIPLNGYGARKGKPATGVHDRIFVKALVLSSNGLPEKESVRVAIVTTDLCMITRDIRREVLSKIEGSGIDDANLLLSASHTHSAPAAMDRRWLIERFFGDFDEELFDTITSQIAKTIKEAGARLRPAKLGIASTTAQGLNRNRREPTYNYDTRLFSTPSPPPEGDFVTDSELWVMEVAGQDGEVIALLVNFAAHATVLGADNLLVSADWPGAMQRSLEGDLKDTIVLYTNGAAGDQAPDDHVEGNDFGKMEQFGERVADEVRELLDGIEFKDEVRIASSMLYQELPRLSYKFLALPRFLTGRFGFETEAAIMAIRIGDAVLVGIPGEPIAEVGLEIKRESRKLGFKYPVVVGLANDYIGYIVNEKEYRKGGYETTMNFFGKDAGAIISEAALKAVKETLSSGTPRN